MHTKPFSLITRFKKMSGLTEGIRQFAEEGIMVQKWGVLACILGITMGCAGMKVLPVRPVEPCAAKGAAGKPKDDGLVAEADAKGFRYYQASPYVLITTDNDGGLTSTIVYLPDPNKLFSARPYNVMSTNHTTLEFANGVLSTSAVDVDETILPKAVISAVETAAGAAIKALLDEPAADRLVAPPYLYKIVTKKDSTGKVTVTLVGGAPPASSLPIRSGAVGGGN
jgi:hypothetical protein